MKFSVLLASVYTVSWGGGGQALTWMVGPGTPLFTVLMFLEKPLTVTQWSLLQSLMLPAAQS